MSLYASTPGKEDYTHQTSCTCTSNVIFICTQDFNLIDNELPFLVYFASLEQFLKSCYNCCSSSDPEMYRERYIFYIFQKFCQNWICNTRIHIHVGLS